MSPHPPPRAALHKAADSDVHPAAPRPAATSVDLDGALDASLAAAGPEHARARKGKKGRSAENEPDGQAVDLVVPVPKAMRKRLKAKAAEHGYTPEEATLALLRIWLDG